MRDANCVKSGIVSPVAGRWHAELQLVLCSVRHGLVLTLGTTSYSWQGRCLKAKRKCPQRFTEAQTNAQRQPLAAALAASPGARASRVRQAFDPGRPQLPDHHCRSPLMLLNIGCCLPTSVRAAPCELLLIMFTLQARACYAPCPYPNSSSAPRATRRPYPRRG